MKRFQSQGLKPIVKKIRAVRITDTLSRFRTQLTPQFTKGFVGKQDKALRGSDGLASIVIVSVLIVLITLVSLGFARIMSRASHNALNNQLGAAANYAAQSGINDAVKYLQANPNAVADDCKDLSAVGEFANANLSGDNTTEYTCVLINQNPPDLQYQQIPPSQSQVVKATTAAMADQLMFSWQSTNRTKNALPPSGSTPLQSVVSWSNSNYAPIFRVTLYPIPSDGQLAGVQSASKTFFFYPTNGAGQVTNIPYSTADASLQPVNCATKTVAGFSGTADYDCNVVINNLSNAIGGLSYFYIRMTPIYAQADVKVQANAVGQQPTNFVNAQAIIDTTGKSGNVVKRLQARVDIGSSSGSSSGNISPTDEAIPEYALRTAMAVCKRLNIGPNATVESSYCNLSITPPPKPLVDTGNVSSVGQNTATLHGAVNPQGYNVTTCRFDYGTTQSYGSSANCSNSPGAGKGFVDVSANIGGLNAGTTYHYRLVGANANGTTEGNDRTFKTDDPPPTPPEIAKWEWSGSNRFVYHVRNSDSCSIDPDGSTPPQQFGPILNQDFGYNYGPANTGAWLRCTNQGQNQRERYAAPPPPSINVRFSDPNDTFGVQGYDFTFRTTVQPQAPNDCRDGLHTYVACFDLTVDQDGNKERISYCDLSPGGRINNGFGQRHWSSQGRWIFYTLGWSSYPGDQTISATCYSKDGGINSGSASIRVHWTTCEDRGQKGEYGTDVARNGCYDKPSEEPPYVPPGNGSGSGPPGGGCCGGTPPPGNPVPPPYDPCALNNRRPLYPNFGFINLPNLYFGLWFC